MDLETGQLAVILGALGDLAGQFACRCKHQHAAGLERRLIVGVTQPVDAGQHEGGGLAGAGLRDTHQVAPFENGRDRPFLDRRGSGIALEVKRLKDGLRQPKIGKLCHENSHL